MAEAPTLQLLSKITVGGQELKNRIALASLTRARVTPTEDPYDINNTIPTDLLAEYYEQRSSGGIVLTEATAISEEGCGWLNAPHIHKPEHVEGWKNVVDRVHAKGGVIYCQLWHMGRQSHSSYHPTTNRIVSASNIPLSSGEARTNRGEKVEPEVPHSLTVEEIKVTVQDYVTAAQCAKEAGFDGIVLHGANGYLIDQFFQSRTNVRTDEYGGSFENRARFFFEILDAIVASGAYPVERIAVKISPNGVFGDMGSEDNYEFFGYLAKAMSAYNLAFVEIMDGLGFGFHNKCKAFTCMDLKKEFSGVVMANIGLTKEIAEGMIRSGAADMASFGRLYMSNPDLPERFANGWPVEPEPEYQHWWQYTAEKGYTDWPTYSAP